jgi:hypothetical protein
MQSKTNNENLDPMQVEFTQKQVSSALLGADPGKLAHYSIVQEYYHAVKAHHFDDKRKSLDGSNILVEKLEQKPFVELTIRNESFVPKPRNEALPVHFQDLLATPSTI